MPTTEHQQSSFLGRSILSIRRNQVISMEANQEQELEHLELFQKHVADCFLDLLSSQDSQPSSDCGGDSVNNILSIAWVRKLLDDFLCCEAEFKAVLVLDSDLSRFAKAPIDRLIHELLDRYVKALDICNAITNGIELIRQWQKFAEIAVSALEQKRLEEGHVRRAKKALNSLLTSMTIGDKESIHNRVTERMWSFGRKGSGSSAVKDQNAGNFRSSPLSISRTWSAAKQLQAMSTNLVAPRGGESTGLALPIYIMSSILVFVMWALVVSIPCQERSGLPMHFPVSRQLVWAGPIIGLQEKIAEEWKKKEKKGSVGLLDEMQRLERCGHSLIELADSFQFPLEAEKLKEMQVQVAELAETSRKMEEGLVPLQRQVREVFHRIVRSRSEVLHVLDQAGKSSLPVL